MTDPMETGTGTETPQASGDGSARKRWYIVHTYSGHEVKAKQSLLERAKVLGHANAFDEILIPEETVVELVKGGEKRTSKRKFFHGSERRDLAHRARHAEGDRLRRQ